MAFKAPLPLSGKKKIVPAPPKVKIRKKKAAEASKPVSAGGSAADQPWRQCSSETERGPVTVIAGPLRVSRVGTGTPRPGSAVPGRE